MLFLFYQSTNCECETIVQYIKHILKVFWWQPDILKVKHLTRILFQGNELYLKSAKNYGVTYIWQNSINCIIQVLQIIWINQHCPFTNLLPHIINIYIINRPSIAGAVLQTPSQLIHSFSQSVSHWSFSSKSSKYYKS